MAHAPTPALIRLRALLLGLLLPAGAAAQGTASWIDQLHLSATATAGWVNNLSRTSYEPTRKDAATYELSLSGSQPRQLAPNLLVVASGDITSATVPDFDLTNQVRFGGRVTFQSKLGLGPQATVFQAGAGASYKAARFEGDRGTGTELNFQVAKRVLPNLRLAANAQWDIDDHWTLSGSASRLSGDIVANAAWAVWAQAISGGFGPAVFNYYTARPWEVTNLYGAGWVSYNVEADVDLWSVALAYSFSDRSALELRHAGAYVVNKIGITYPTDSWTLGFTHRF